MKKFLNNEIIQMPTSEQETMQHTNQGDPCIFEKLCLECCSGWFNSRVKHVNSHRDWSEAVPKRHTSKLCCDWLGWYRRLWTCAKAWRQLASRAQTQKPNTTQHSNWLKLHIARCHHSWLLSACKNQPPGSVTALGHATVCDSEYRTSSEACLIAGFAHFGSGVFSLSRPSPCRFLHRRKAINASATARYKKNMFQKSKHVNANADGYGPFFAWKSELNSNEALPVADSCPL